MHIDGCFIGFTGLNGSPLPPSLEIQQYATEIKEDFRDRDQSQAAFKSPSHITLSVRESRPEIVHEKLTIEKIVAYDTEVKDKSFISLLCSQARRK